MKITLSLLISILSLTISKAQELIIEPEFLDFGTVEMAGSLSSYLVLKNDGDKTTFLLRADAPKGMDIYTSSKKISPGDTIHLRFYYTPKTAGKISEKISLLHAGSPDPVEIKIRGNLEKLLGDGLTSCVNFDPKTDQGNAMANIPLLANHSLYITNKSSNQTVDKAAVTFTSLVTNQKLNKPVSGGFAATDLPIGPYLIEVKAQGFGPITKEVYVGMSGLTTRISLIRDLYEPIENQPPKPNLPEIITQKPQEPKTPEEPVLSKEKTPQPVEEDPDNTELDENVYNPNNLIFLIDVSGSMRASNRLPLLKESIYTLLQPIRDIDMISVVAYSSEAEIIVEPSKGSLKRSIYAKVDTMKAGGSTAGSEGLQKAYALAKRNYIAGGNNRIILATDGVFRVSGKERKLIEESAADNKKPIYLTIAAFDSDKDAIGMLKNLSKLGGGSVVQIKKSSQAERILLDEIKSQSRKR